MQLMGIYMGVGITIAIMLTLLILALYIKYASETMAGPIPLLGTPDIRIAQLAVIIAFFVGFFGILHFFVEMAPEMEWLKSLNGGFAKSLQMIEERKATLERNLNIIEVSVTDELFIIDDRAWAKNDGVFVEVDVNEAEKGLVGS